MYYCQDFPHLYTPSHTSAVLPSILAAALRLRGFYFRVTKIALSESWRKDPESLSDSVRQSDQLLRERMTRRDFIGPLLWFPVATDTHRRTDFARFGSSVLTVVNETPVRTSSIGKGECAWAYLRRIKTFSTKDCMFAGPDAHKCSTATSDWRHKFDNTQLWNGCILCTTCSSVKIFYIRQKGGWRHVFLPNSVSCTCTFFSRCTCSFFLLMHKLCT